MYDYKMIEKELKKSGVYPQGYWNPLYVNLQNNDLTMQLSERSIGKTTGWLLYGIEMYIKYGVIIHYIREDRRHLNRAYVKDLFSTICHCGYIDKLTDGKYNHVVYNSMQRKWYFALLDENGEVTETDKQHFMIGLSCDMSDNLKSSYVCDKADFIIVDEFCSQAQRNYFSDLYNIISTLVRERDSVKIIFLSNTIDRTHWIFDEFPLREVIDSLEEGQIVKFTTELGMRFYVEFVYHEETRQRKEFVNRHIFGFKNNKLNAIKGGGWNMKLYPHLEKGIDFETVVNYIAVETTSCYLALDVVIIDNHHYLYCHKRTHLYDDTIIYTTNNLMFDSRKRYGFGCGTGFDKFIWNFVKNGLVLYGHNRDGMLLDSYIKKVKQERIYF